MIWTMTSCDASDGDDNAQLRMPYLRRCVGVRGARSICDDPDRAGFASQSNKILTQFRHRDTQCHWIASDNWQHCEQGHEESHDDEIDCIRLLLSLENESIPQDLD